MRQCRFHLPAATLLVVGLTVFGTTSGAPPAVAADFPANPTSKTGHTLDFQEEFDGTTLDLGKWPSGSRSRSTLVYPPPGTAHVRGQEQVPRDRFARAPPLRRQRAGPRHRA
ncbi:hypothetical protein ACIRL2_39240 [Embleya sp. NPDC127516]|uniref:hypothetical protein n=1 Tax=Embleya sp. NPDC127516 TaxID=3363990 RepID=UPI0037FE3BE9